MRFQNPRMSLRTTCRSTIGYVSVKLFVLLEVEPGQLSSFAHVFEVS